MFVHFYFLSLTLCNSTDILCIRGAGIVSVSLNSDMSYLQGILQSQGRISRKMRFMPSSLSSNSHRLLTALVDSRHKKVYKVKNCVTDIDPEREKEEKEKVITYWMLLWCLCIQSHGFLILIALMLCRLKVKILELMYF